MDKLEKDLTGKLKLLKFTFENTSEIVSKANIVAIEREREALIKIKSNNLAIKCQWIVEKDGPFSRAFRQFVRALHRNRGFDSCQKTCL